MPPSSHNFSPELWLKLETLFSILKAEHYQVTTDNYVDFLHVAIRTDAQSLKELAYKICPIVVTNENEQARFYEIIHELDALSLDDLTGRKTEVLDPPVIQVNNRRIFFIAMSAVIAILLLTAAISYLLWKPTIDIFGSGSIKPLVVIKKGDTYTDNASKLDYFENHPSDTSNFDFNWNFGDGAVQNGFTSAHKYDKSGDYIITQTIRSNRYSISKSSDSIYVHVCEHLPKLELQQPSTAVRTGKPVYFTALSDSTAVKFRWVVDDLLIQVSKTPAFIHTFYEEGYHTISCTAYPDSIYPNCEADATMRIEVLNAARNYAVNITGVTKLPPDEWKLKTWAVAVIWLMVAVFMMYVWPKTKSAKGYLFQADQVFKGNIYEVPLRINELNGIRPDKKLLRMLGLMRRRADEEVHDLDIPKTLDHTLKNMGLTQLVFSPRKKFQEYLLLIDNTNPSSMVSHLFGYLSLVMQKYDVRLQVYYFDRRFMFHNKQVPAGITFDQVFNRHPDSVPIVMGDGKNFLYSLVPVVQKKYLSRFNNYHLRIIITPVPRHRWGIEEQVLSRHFLIAAADEDDMEQLFEKIHLSPELQSDVAQNNPSGSYDIDFRNVNDLSEYFNKSEFMLQWLSSLAVYPKLRWEMILAFGKALSEKYNMPNGISYNAVLEICRIPWLMEGSIPPSVRLELLKNLHTDNEIAVRYALIGMLEEAIVKYGKGYYYDVELEDQLTINKFILYVHDSTLYSQYKHEAERLKLLWKNGLLLDSPVKLYLEGGGNKKWKTPLKAGRKVISLKTYFNAGQPWFQWDNFSYRTMVIVFIIATITSLGLLYISTRNSPPANGLSPLYAQTMADSSIQVRYKLTKNMLACDDTATSFVEDLSGNFEYNGRKYPVTYDTATSTITAHLPYAVFLGKSGKVSLSMDSGNPSYVENGILFDTVYTEGVISFMCNKINSGDTSVIHAPAYSDSASRQQAVSQLEKQKQMESRKSRVVAAFIVRNPSGCSPLPVTFVDQSFAGSGIRVRTWNFGDGTVITQNNSIVVEHIYTAPGNYTATLTVKNIYGNSDTISRMIVVHPNPVVDFEANVTTAAAPATIMFKDKSETGNGAIRIWEWDLDEAKSIMKNPVQVYKNAGYYTIALQVTNNWGCSAVKTKRNYITITSKSTVY